MDNNGIKRKQMEHLKHLRDTRKWSKSDMAKKIKSEMPKLGFDEPKYDDVTGGQTIYQLEHGDRNLTVEYAITYSKIFDTPLDYILGVSDELLKQTGCLEEMMKRTGLSEEALFQLKMLKDDDDHTKIQLASMILEHGFFSKILKGLHSLLLNHITVNSPLDKYDDDAVAVKEDNDRFFAYLFSRRMDDVYCELKKMIEAKENDLLEQLITESISLNNEVLKGIDDQFLSENRFNDDNTKRQREFILKAIERSERRLEGLS